jgi:hypothetical protein
MAASLRKRLAVNARFLFFDFRRIYYSYVVHPVNVVGVLIFALAYAFGPSLLAALNLTNLGRMVSSKQRLIAGLLAYVPIVIVIIIAAAVAEPERKLRRVALSVVVSLATSVVATLILMAATEGAPE